MEQKPAMTGGAAKEARADEESGAESESDEAPDARALLQPHAARGLILRS